MSSIPPGVDLCAIPAAESPDGQYDFKNPESLGTTNLSIGVILTTISTFLTFARIYMSRKRLGAAEYCTIAASVINIAFTGVVCAQFNYNRHMWDIPVCWFTAAYFKILYLQTMLFAPIFLFSKASILLLYRQLFAIERRVKTYINIGLVVAILIYVPNIPLSAVFDAPPWGEPWESMLTSKEPFKMIKWAIVQGTLTNLLDLYIFILPLPIIVRLHMPLGKRLQLAGVFMTALMGVIASLIALVYRIELLRSNDTLWITAAVSICAVVEANVGIIVSCLPAFAQLLKLHVGESSFFRSIISALLGRTGNSDSNKPSSGPAEDRPKMVTIGSDPTQRRRNYYELNDSALLTTQATAVDIDPEAHAPSSNGIFCSTMISQHGEFRTTEQGGSTGGEATFYFEDGASR